MPRQPYRIETVYPSKGKPQHYLAKTVQFQGKRRKARVYIGVQPIQTAKEKLEYSRQYAFQMESDAAQKKAELSSRYYESKYLNPSQIGILEHLRFLYQAVMDLMTTNEVEVYERDFEIHYVQGTTSIEGNTFSLSETKRLLEYGLSPEKKSLREINEIQNFKSVVPFRNGHRGRIGLNFIRTLHRLVVQNIDHDSAGIFRRSDDFGVGGSDLRLTPSVLIEEELQETINEYYQGLSNKGHPFELAVMFHHKFEVIHPFTDGNGRVGREILNYMLKRSQYPRLLFLGPDRDNYIRALSKGDSGQYSDMITAFYELIVKQRSGVLEEKLRKLAESSRSGQSSLEEFITF